MKRMLALLLCLLPLTGAFGQTAPEERLTDAELTELLYELSLQEDARSEFLVLPEDYSLPVTGLEGTYNLLIIGVDTDSPKMAGRSDTMVLACLDVRKGRLVLISFMRDLYVSIPGKGHNKLNAAYAFGGARLLKKTLETVFGVRVDGTLAVNFSSMAALVDALGGVEVTVAPHELKSLNGILSYYNYQRRRPEQQGRLKASGTQVLTGLQTLSYARIRKIDSDFERVKRQQRVLQAIFGKISTLDYSDLIGLVTANMDRVKTDVPLSRAISLAAELLPLGDIRIETLSIPVRGAYSSRLIRGTYFIVPALNKNTAAIRSLLESP